MKKFFIICIVFIVIGYIIWASIYMDRITKENFAKFNSAEINNRIESTDIVSKGTGVKLDDGRQFVFYPFTDKKLNEGEKFGYVAEGGIE